VAYVHWLLNMAMLECCMTPAAVLDLAACVYITQDEMVATYDSKSKPVCHIWLSSSDLLRLHAEAGPHGLWSQYPGRHVAQL
jgi:hypothetical protein